MSATEHLELPIEGMTCAACARRVESSLNRVDGVTARVNFATEIASIEYDGALTDDTALADAVRSAGYTPDLSGRAPADAPMHDAHDHSGGADGGGALLTEGARAAIAMASAVPTVVITMVPGADFSGSQWVVAALATIATWVAGWPIHRSAATGARHGSFGMDALVSLGTLAAWSWSSAQLFVSTPAHAHGGAEAAHGYFESAAVVTAFVLAGRWLEGRAKHDSRAALRALGAYAVGEVTTVDADGTQRVRAPEALQPGDRFLVRPGERVATDGVVVEGESSIDQSLVTGESMPVPVGPDDDVIGGTVNADGRLVVRVTRVGADTALATIGRLLATAQTSTAPAQRLADRISGVFVPAVIALAFATFVGWLFAGADVGDALEIAIAVLVIACPCALGLATPMALLAGTVRGARSGVVVSSASALEQSVRIDTVVFDKTGTLTDGAMSVVDVITADDVERRDALALAAAVERASEHPLARAIVAAAESAGATIEAVSSFTNVAGFGAAGTVGHHEVVVGRAALLQQRDIEVPDELRSAIGAEAPADATVVFVAWDGAARAVIACRDTVRASSAATLTAVREFGARPLLVTGDSAEAAAGVAATLGIDEVRAGVTPADKVAIVRDLQEAGRRVAMVGDGVNDAPALAQADLGIAMGSGTDVAIAASDITLLHADPADAAFAIRLARRTVGTIRSNLVWAFAYNVAALPLAVAGLVDPMIAGAAMALSSIFVVGNSLRLRRFS